MVAVILALYESSLTVNDEGWDQGVDHFGHKSFTTTSRPVARTWICGVSTFCCPTRVTERVRRSYVVGKIEVSSYGSDFVSKKCILGYVRVCCGVRRRLHLAESGVRRSVVRWAFGRNLDSVPVKMFHMQFNTRNIL